MYMAYTTNPHLPKVRMKTVLLVRHGWSIRKASRYVGVHPSTVMRWVRRAPQDGRLVIPTVSSRPRYHPAALSREMIETIRTKRLAHHRCAEVIHQELLNDGLRVSLSSVKRTLQREGLLRSRSPWKRWHAPQPRPLATNAGDLVQLDTIHVQPRSEPRFYVYTLIDVMSRWAHAKVTSRANCHESLRFLREAKVRAPFAFQTLQSDHGSEFSISFSDRSTLAHRHSRVRQPNDNGHLERFNRTLREECFGALYPSPRTYQRALRNYLPYYNTERLHLGLNLKTPSQVLRRY